ncbi:MAG: dTDP-glucose 4,6-dehydratase 2 [Alphaproteobacteria bacterium MarineAlpha6_Bin4]|nr:MAG: dTDP-glucose 4,6-dehydratase 2 [Alphaproteobacteria bacterium MarineAlpha6_Bin3]PPR37564.1 MAG: dTDP-glucose 4,6-dehydratase 2 [Alphaproteobacteria bacterium MarineAlpha6_Bin4]|tara:strand:- start:10321 stop:11382 length:1062 start_codon:yes stop_codon:yes gene_type:complete
MKTYLVSGGAGFIGSNFVRSIIKKSDIKVINIDNLTYAGSISTIKDLLKYSNHKFIKTDIGNIKKIKYILKKYKPDFVINFAAETHVDRSIDNPEIFIKTNILSFFNFINLIKEFFFKLNKRKKNNFRFIQVSTDEVYGSIKKGKALENSEISTSSPYSASKSSSEQIALSYYKTYKLPVIIPRSSNNYGQFQFPEKLIPLSIINALNEKKINIYGNGLQIRNWIHVDDNNDAIINLINKGKVGQIYNIGNNVETTNINIVKNICKILDEIIPRNNKQSYSKLINFVTDRPGHDKRYANSIKKIIRETKWRPKINLKNGLKMTVLWYLENKHWWKEIQKKKYKGERLGRVEFK